MSQYCPLCNQEKSESELFCNDCKNQIENDYEVVVPQYKTVAKTQPDAEPAAGNSPETVLRFPPKPKRRKRAVVIIVFLVVLSVVSFFTYMHFVRSSNLDISAWDTAQKTNTIAGYLAYIEQHPQGKYINSANEKLLELKEKQAQEWDAIRFSGNAAALRNFKTQYPQSPYLPLINERLDSLAWIAALNDNTAESYSNYLQMVQKGEFNGSNTGEAEKRYRMLFQSYPVIQSHLDSIRLTVDGFFTALSAVDAEAIGNYLAVSVFRFFNAGGGSREKIVGNLLVSSSRSSSRTIKFVPNIQAIAYEKNTNNNYLCHIPLQKSYKSSEAPWKTVMGYIVHAELDRDFRIVSIYETKPFGDVP